ncbi:hypothetical protein [Brachybacterium alimentarium]|uniref:hypothetical protein n=1 Tax=Brachybacterium alimentarium TaxID=47845 RepID=UPI001FE8F9C0|nr:hypothetical protein [Brachybacterium alimentarium]
MTEQFNPPPNWPEPPRDGWTPPTDFRPGPGWGPVPAGWRLWVSHGAQASQDAAAAPLLDSEDVPASGARPRDRVSTYPITVVNPGMWSHNHLEDEDYGFPPAKPVTDRPRLRLGVTITVTVLGFVLAALTAIAFVLLVGFAVDDLPAALSDSGTHLLTTLPGAYGTVLAPVAG